MTDVVQVAKDQNHFAGEHFSELTDWLIRALREEVLFIRMSSDGRLRWCLRLGWDVEVPVPPGSFIIQEPDGHLSVRKPDEAIN